MINLLKRIIVQIQEGKSTETTTLEFLRLVRENQSQIAHLNIYKDEVTQTEEEDNVTAETLHFDDLFFNDPSMMIEWNNTNRQLI